MTARRVVVLVGSLGALGLAGCADLGQHAAAITAAGAPTPAEPVPASKIAAAPPKPAEGLWAILDPGCGKPSLADTRKWPRCASPFWINHNSAVVVRSAPTPGAAGAQSSYRAGYQLAAGDPLIAQIGNRKDGYLFLALTNLDRDSQGLLVAATGAAFVCTSGAGPSVSAEPNRNGCAGQSPDVVRRAAEQTLKDPTALSRVAWIAAGAPATQ